MHLRQSTAVVVQFGPFVSVADSVTLSTGLVSALDHASTGIKLSKNGGAQAVRHATVTATTYDAHGMYRVTLDTTDTATLGRLKVVYTDSTTVLPVWLDLMVMPAAAYDAVYGTSGFLVDAASVRTAVGLASANLDTQVDALPTNAELSTALAAADDAVLAAIGALNNLSAVSVRAALGLASANLDTQLGDLPTNAELATALGTADYAVLAAIAALNNLSPAQLSSALASADDAVLAAIAALTIPTATENADAYLKRDMSAVTGAASRSPLNALRFMRNRWTIVSGVLTVYAEDDTTPIWTSAVVQTAGNPVSSSDPA